MFESLKNSKILKFSKAQNFFKNSKPLTTPRARLTSVAEGVCKTSVLLVHFYLKRYV